MKYDLIDLPGELENRPNCNSCLDEGILKMGSDVQSTTFCKCDQGEETFIAWADAQSQMEFECHDIEEW